MAPFPFFPRLHALVTLGMFVASITPVLSVDYGLSRAIQASATVSNDPTPEIALVWPLRLDIVTYTVEIVGPDGSTRLESASGDSTGFVDTAITLGESYEYRIRGDVENTSRDAYSALLAAVEAPLKDDRGLVVLVVDATKAAGLISHLSRLERDLIGDGWRVHRVDVSPELPPVAVKEVIRTIYLQNPSDVNAALLLGNIAVPYSGSVTPDGHYGIHTGAWPADVYYGDMDGEWTDSVVNVTQASRPENHNVPWDGKFDVSKPLTDIEIAVGRVDFSDLPAFAESEETLLANYLDKNHRYRHREFILEKQGFVQDGLNWLSTGPGSGAYRTTASQFGQNSLTVGTWSSALLDPTTSYAIAWGLSTGSYTSVSGITSSATLATTDYRAGFQFFLGSYSGDWDNTDNLLRAALASGTHSVATGWNGRPIWNLHQLATDNTIGDALLSTQNHQSGAQGYVGYGSGQVHTALMGDPTLRLDLVSPPTDLAVVADPSGNLVLSWQAPAGESATYHVYRAANWDSDFVRLTVDPLTETSYVDNSGAGEAAVYMVRAVALQTTGGGSFYNASQGVFIEWPESVPSATAPSMTVEALDSAIHEKGNRTATFLIKREGDLSEALDIQCVIGGGVLGVDVLYDTAELIFPAGLSEMEFTVTALANALLEADRALTMLLLESTLYQLDSTKSIAATVLLDPAFDQWRKQQFTVQELADTSVSGEQADVDDDGVPNLVEYAIGSDPLAYNGVDFSVSPATSEEACDVVVYSRSANDLSDVCLILETCDDGVSWEEASPDAIYLDPIPGFPELEQVTAEFACGPARRFFRFTISPKICTDS